MASLLNASGLAQRYGAVPLFTGLALNVNEGDRLGIVGPNGSGKSTLLEILAGRRLPDAGTVALRKNLRVAYVPQVSDYAKGTSVRKVIESALVAAGTSENDRAGRMAETLGRAGFQDFDVDASTMSGGWRKRLSIAEAWCTSPDLLLLDEPTNHLDLAGIVWLERLLTGAAFASVVVSHDRYFLENVVTGIAELNRIYPEGLFRTAGDYSTFLEKKSEFLAAQARQEESLQNRVRTEIEWLRRGPKARATKSKARIDKANQMIGQLSDMKERNQVSRADIDFRATDRKTKRLIELQQISYDVDGRPLLRDVNLLLTAGVRVGLAGPNGSGKTTLLRLLRGELGPSEGEIKRADHLQIVHFDQNRKLDETLTLRRALSPDSDSVEFNGQTLHVASWAARFLFNSEQLNQPVSRLSGGERARVLIAKLMLEPADVLLLDEPTNDLDIPTLEILEESFLEFKGALVLVTHDRYLIDRVSTVVWGLTDGGRVEQFADLSQWDEATRGKAAASTMKPMEANPVALNTVTSSRRKLSYLDHRDWETIETRIAEAERELGDLQSVLERTEVSTSPSRLSATLAEIEVAQTAVDTLYNRWAELEAKREG